MITFRRINSELIIGSVVRLLLIQLFLCLRLSSCTFIFFAFVISLHGHRSGGRRPLHAGDTFYDADQEVDVVKSIQVVGGGTAGRSSQLR